MLQIELCDDLKNWAFDYFSSLIFIPALYIEDLSVDDLNTTEFLLSASHQKHDLIERWNMLL